MGLRNLMDLAEAAPGDGAKDVVGLAALCFLVVIGFSTLGGV